MARRKPGKRRLLPREHGFWVMTLAVLATALTRTAGSLAAWSMALAVLVASSLLGGLVAGSVRRAGPAQIASAALLSFAGVPVELVAGARIEGALLTAAAAFSVLGHFSEMMVTGAAAVVCAALSCIQPSVKQMKPVGLTFAGLSALSALLLAL
jgi:hypothetical protein